MGWHKIEDSNSCHQIRILICYSTTPILHKNEPLCLVHEQYITTLTNNQNGHPHRVNFGCRYRVDFLCLIRLNLGHLQADICVLSSWYSVGGSNTYFQLERLISLTSQKNRAYIQAVHPTPFTTALLTSLQLLTQQRAPNSHRWLVRFVAPINLWWSVRESNPCLRLEGPAS